MLTTLILNWLLTQLLPHQMTVLETISSLLASLRLVKFGAGLVKNGPTGH